MLSAQTVVEGVLLVSGTSDIDGSVLNDTIVQRNCSLHVRGNLKGSLTIEPGASVVIEGSVDGKVVNRGGKLVVRNSGIAAFVRVDATPEAEASGVLKINLGAIAFNWDAIAKRVAGECAAVVKGDAYGCGIDPVAATLAEVGCNTFFVSNLAEAKSVRVASSQSTIYVLNGLYAGAGPVFAEINARPVIGSLVEVAEWDAFAAASQWRGGFALSIDTGVSRRGISLQEAAAFAVRTQAPNHGVTLLMSQLDHPAKPDQALHKRQIAALHDLHRLYGAVPASLAGSSDIFVDPKTHFDLVRPGGALYGVNPTPGAGNPMRPVIELQSRILQVLHLASGETIAYSHGWTAKRPARLALVSAGYADGFPLSRAAPDKPLHAIVGGKRCRIVGRASMDWLAIDVTDLPDPRMARRDEMVTLIGAEIGVDDLAAAAKFSGCEVLCNLGRRFRRIYHAS